MSKSHNRRKRARRSRRTAASTQPPPPTASMQELKALITEEVLEEIELSLCAEAAGDVDRALVHFERHPLAHIAPHYRYLQEVRDLGADAPGWVWSRWVLQQAHRWMFLNQDERLFDAAFITVGSVFSDVDQDRARGHEPEEFLHQVMAMDWMCRQRALYDLGGLQDYLDHMVQPPLLKRADRVLAWPRATMSAFRVEHVWEGVATLTDLATGRTRQILNIGLLAERLGSCVVGRLVPLRGEPGWIFDSRPRTVTHAVARELVHRMAEQGPTGWTSVLGEAVRSGELSWPLDVTRCLTPLSSDLPVVLWTCPDDERTALAVDMCAAQLERVLGGERLAAVSAPYVGLVLADSRVHAAVAEQLTRPELAPAWARLARHTHDPVRSRCLALAACSEDTRLAG